jgi:serine/threonine-protein kinase
MKPENIMVDSGKRGDGRSDIYAVGVMLYEMLTGKVPFTGNNAFLIMNDRLLNSPVPPREIDPNISPALQEIIYRALEREPFEPLRHGAREFAKDLKHQDQVGVSERPELHDRKRPKSHWPKRIFNYALLALVPIVIFSLLLWVVRK